jgi:filamentous hemagglutinin
MPQADQTLFLNVHSAVTENLAASATQLSAALAAGDRPQLNARFFSSLVEATNNKNKQSDLGNFDDLIASLFPAAATATEAGNIAVFASQIKTEQGGAINLFAPTGSVYAGLTTGISGKSPSTQGIFTIHGGAVGSLVKNDFLVNQGRVFTLGGGDITLASQYNDISAGKGAKTASSAPPPLITIDPNGNIKVDVSGSISGSGIATLKTHPDQLAGNIYVEAPRGTFDAGDAGVRSSGSVEITASEVLNGGNISAGGAISGAPTTVAAPSLGSVAAPSGTSQNSDEVTKNLSNATAAAANSLNVEVVGYGDDSSSTDGTCDDSTLGSGSCNNNDRKKKKI